MEDQGPNFVAFLNENASAVFALLGALVTGCISVISARLLRRQDYSLKLWEKIAERRIDAHEKLLESAKEMRIMIALGGVDEQGGPLRTPDALMSKGDFDNFFAKFTLNSLSGSAWQTIEAKREASLIQDYLVTLYQTLIGVPSNLFPNVGTIIRQDFIDLSSSLEKQLSGFFTKDIHRLDAGTHNDWHKYPRDEMLRRLDATELMKHQHLIATCSHPSMQKPLLADDEGGSQES